MLTSFTDDTIVHAANLDTCVDIITEAEKKAAKVKMTRNMEFKCSDGHSLVWRMASRDESHQIKKCSHFAHKKGTAPHRCHGANHSKHDETLVKMYDEIRRARGATMEVKGRIDNRIANIYMEMFDSEIAIEYQETPFTESAILEKYAAYRELGVYCLFAINKDLLKEDERLGKILLKLFGSFIVWSDENGIEVMNASSFGEECVRFILQSIASDIHYYENSDLALETVRLMVNTVIDNTSMSKLCTISKPSFQHFFNDERGLFYFGVNGSVDILVGANLDDPFVLIEKLTDSWEPWVQALRVAKTILGDATPGIHGLTCTVAVRNGFKYEIKKIEFKNKSGKIILNEVQTWISSVSNYGLVSKDEHAESILLDAAKDHASFTKKIDLMEGIGWMHELAMDGPVTTSAKEAGAYIIDLVASGKHSFNEKSNLTKDRIICGACTLRMDGDRMRAFLMAPKKMHTEYVNAINNNTGEASTGVASMIAMTAFFMMPAAALLYKNDNYGLDGESTKNILRGIFTENLGGCFTVKSRKLFAKFLLSSPAKYDRSIKRIITKEAKRYLRQDHSKGLEPYSNRFPCGLLEGDRRRSFDAGIALKIINAVNKGLTWEEAKDTVLAP